MRLKFNCRRQRHGSTGMVPSNTRRHIRPVFSATATDGRRFRPRLAAYSSNKNYNPILLNDNSSIHLVGRLSRIIGIFPFRTGRALPFARLENRPVRLFLKTPRGQGASLLTIHRSHPSMVTSINKHLHPRITLARPARKRVPTPWLATGAGICIFPIVQVGLVPWHRLPMIRLPAGPRSL